MASAMSRLRFRSNVSIVDRRAFDAAFESFREQPRLRQRSRSSSQVKWS